MTMANTLINRLGPVIPFELAEEESTSLPHVAGAYLACDAIFGLTRLFADIETETMPEAGRLDLLGITASCVRRRLADLLRIMPATAFPGQIVANFAPIVARLGNGIDAWESGEVAGEAKRLAGRMAEARPGKPRK